MLQHFIVLESYGDRAVIEMNMQSGKKRLIKRETPPNRAGIVIPAVAVIEGADIEIEIRNQPTDCSFEEWLEKTKT